MKNDGLDQSDLEFSAKTPTEKLAAEVWPSIKKMDELNALDFDDLMSKVVQLFTTSEEVRNVYKTKFKHILVDEYQDTNPVQYKLLRLLTSKLMATFLWLEMTGKAFILGVEPITASF